MVGNKVVKFLKIYLVFLLFVLTVNLSLELIVPTPERKAFIDEHGFTSFITEKIKVIVIFYMFYNLLGSIIFLIKNYKWNKMGLLSFLFGFFLEFLLMKPDWVQNICALRITPSVITAVIISALYWFGAWGAPAYILQKLFLKERE